MSNDPQSVSITLGGVEYSVPPLDDHQTRRVTGALRAGGRPATGFMDAGFAILRIAFERAEPKVDVGAIQATVQEIGTAADAVLKANSIDPKKVNVLQ